MSASAAAWTLLSLTLALPGSAQEGPSVPVMVGTAAEMDACMSWGSVSARDPGDVLVVRAAPADDAAEIDRLRAGDGLHVCEGREGWLGVVYAPAESGSLDCGVSSPVDAPQPYAGPCRSGWIPVDGVALIAG